MNRIVSEKVCEQVDPVMQMLMWMLYDGIRGVEKAPLHSFEMVRIVEADETISVRLLHRQEHPKYLDEVVFISEVPMFEEKICILRDEESETMMFVSECEGGK